MKKIVAGTWIICLLASGCEYKDVGPDCYHGKVIFSSCCSGTTLVSLESALPIGRAIQVNGQEYPNTIQLPGYLNAGDVYLNLRQFDPDKDNNLFPNPRCYCLIPVDWDVPLMVATALSHTSCPSEAWHLE